MNTFSKNYPEAYRTGIKNFYGRDFVVSEDVLIPRPETEQIIDLALELVSKTRLPGVTPPPTRITNDSLRILDVGTGSGCIALTLALELPASQVFATDISVPALKIAEKNAEKFKLKNVTFLQRDLCKIEISSAEETSETFPEKFDLIIANLPYVDPSWPWLDREALSFEPSLALYTEDNGLALIKKLLSQILTQTLLAPEGFLILEADPCQHPSLISFAKDLGFSLEKTTGFELLFSKHT